MNIMVFHTVSFEPTITLSILALLLGLYMLSTITRSRQNKKAPPEAGGGWPLIGHLHQLIGRQQPPHVTLGDMADKYGPIFTIRLGVHPTLVISSWEMAKECFTINDRAFASRPKYIAFEILGYKSTMIGSNPYGPHWRKVRKMATVEALSNHRLEMLKDVKESEVKAAMKATYDFCVKNGSEKVAAEMKKWFSDITLNVVFRMVVGKRFVGDEESESEENNRTRKALRAFFDLSGSFAISDALPYLRWLDLGGQVKAMKKTAKDLDELAQRLLEEHKRNRSWSHGSGQVVKDKHDIMDGLLSTVDEDEVLEGHDADTTVKTTSLAIILAGTHTTTATLTWALSLLLNNRQVLKKAKDELDTQLGRERLAVESDLNKLVYLEAILKETMRLYPPGPLGVPHESMEDINLGGYHVPAGTHLITNISKLHRDPRVYPNPLEFRPERFLTINKGLEVRGQNFELIPFGAGRRMCPGVSFALQIMQLTLANLLHGFEIVTPNDEAVDMSEHISLASMKASPLQVLLTPHLSSHLYGSGHVGA